MQDQQRMMWLLRAEGLALLLLSCTAYAQLEERSALPQPCSFY